MIPLSRIFTIIEDWDNGGDSSSIEWVEQYHRLGLHPVTRDDDVIIGVGNDRLCGEAGHKRLDGGRH